MTLVSPTTGRLERAPTQRLQAWITKDNQNPVLGILKAPYYIARAHLHVTEAFDSDGSDNIELGDDDDNNRIFTNIDVSSTGVKSVSVASTASGYNGTSRKIEAYYTNGGSEPTQGKALVVLEFFRVPTQP